MRNIMLKTRLKIIQHMFTNQFLSKYSFVGFKGKNQFSTLQYNSIIYAKNDLIN